MSSQTFLEHAPFSPSQPYWLGYDDEAIINAYKNKHRSELGTELHEWASTQIKLGNKVSSNREVEKGLKTHLWEKFKGSENSLVYRDVLLRSVTYLPSETYATVKTFVNDAVGYRMLSEVKVTYSENIFGKADAIRCEDNLLRIFDLKTGSTPAKMEQLYIYAALFCLEEKIRPDGIDFETRIYQNDDVYTDHPHCDDIGGIMNDIIHVDDVVTRLERGKR